VFFVAREAKPETTYPLHFPKGMQRIHRNRAKKNRRYILYSFNFVDNERNSANHSGSETRNIQNVGEIAEEEFACQSM
jgi:hypothetical protein